MSTEALPQRPAEQNRLQNKTEHHYPDYTGEEERLRIFDGLHETALTQRRSKENGASETVTPAPCSLSLCLLLTWFVNQGPQLTLSNYAQLPQVPLVCS